MIGRAQLLHRLDQHADVLLARRAAGEAQQPRRVRQVQLLQQPVTIAPVRVEGVDLDPQRPDDDVAHPGLFQTAGDEPAGRDHPVELRKQLGPAFLDRLLGPFAEMQGRQSGRVRMAEADHRTAGPLARLQRPLPRRIGIPGLDHRRLQRRHPGPPAPHRRRPAIAVAERQLGCVQLDDVVVSGLVSGARDDQTVGHARPVTFQPGLLRQQIAFHPARARRIQHGGIDQPGPGVRRRGPKPAQGLRDLLVQSGNQAELALLDLDPDHAQQFTLGRRPAARANGALLDATNAADGSQSGLHHVCALAPERAELKCPQPVEDNRSP